jgi:hypothetical protein
MSIPEQRTSDPNLWRRIHNLWISEIYQAIKPQVLGRLSISIDQEVTLIELEGAATRMRPDLHLSEKQPQGGIGAGQASKPSGAVAYASGLEEWSTESRHFIVIRHLSGERVVGVLEILSPTNKGIYNRSDLEHFAERRRKLLSSDASYLEVDALPAGTRWLPRSLKDLEAHHGVAWSSLPAPSGRYFQGWAWAREGPLPTIPWSLGDSGTLELDLNRSLEEALKAAGV